jgi:DNA invertase Pin-like site-specific DNA recombinase
MELETKQWIALVQILSRPKVVSALYGRHRSDSKKRTEIWRAAREAGMSPTQIARAFNVSRQAVSKVLNAKNKGHRDKWRKP